MEQPMTDLISKTRYVKQSISLRTDQLTEVRRLVIEDERHGNISRYVQELVDADLAKRQEQEKAEVAA
jgi:Arc/MetJ-type ribon-helix-helix transcriptional regulator